MFRGDAPMKCLWIARYIPYPMDAGAKVYSAQLAQSLAAAGVSIRFLGFGRAAAAPAQSRIEWIAVPGEQRGRAAALFSALPLAAASDATDAYVALLDEQLCERWDVIVLDGYGAGWALDRCYASPNGQQRPLLVHVSHNHEAALWRSMVRGARTSLPKRLALCQNYLKVRALECRIVRNVDLLTTITAEDALAFGHSGTHERALTLTPGHTGWKATERVIDSLTPRRAIIVGSFRWAMKQENLRRFVELADPILARNDIELDIVGDVPGALLDPLRERCRATRFFGFVDDLAPFLSQARIAVVPELIGGGFKLKFLDYIFARVPVATLSRAAAGFPDDIRRATLSCEDLPALTTAIVSYIDRFDELNRMQQSAFGAAEALFDWRDRGLQLQQAMRHLRQELPGS